MYRAMQREDLWLLPARIHPSLQAAQSCSAVIKAHRSHPDHKYLFYFLTKAQQVLPIKMQSLQAAGWPGSAWCLARQELLPGGEGSAAGWQDRSLDIRVSSGVSSWAASRAEPAA